MKKKVEKQIFCHSCKRIIEDHEGGVFMGDSERSTNFELYVHCVDCGKKRSELFRKKYPNFPRVENL